MNKIQLEFFKDHHWNLSRPEGDERQLDHYIYIQLAHYHSDNLDRTQSCAVRILALSCWIMRDQWTMLTHL